MAANVPWAQSTSGGFHFDGTAGTAPTVPNAEKPKDIGKSLPTRPSNPVPAEGKKGLDAINAGLANTPVESSGDTATTGQPTTSADARRRKPKEIGTEIALGF
jgi:hypothetical protein